jgi:hypothetical protein
VLLSGQFNRRGQWQRIALAVIFGMMILFAATGLRGATATYGYLVPVAYLNLLLPAFGACWLLVDHVHRRIVSRA